jgi:hypothetical protein
VPAKSPVFDPSKPVKGTKLKRKTLPVVPTKRARKVKYAVSTKAVPTKAVRKAKRVLPKKPVPKTKTKPVVPAKSVSKTKTKPVTLAKPKVKPVPIAVPTKGAKTKAFVAAAKSSAKASAAKPTLVAGPGLRCLANHQLRRSATGLLYCVFCDR